MRRATIGDWMLLVARTTLAVANCDMDQRHANRT